MTKSKALPAGKSLVVGMAYTRPVGKKRDAPKLPRRPATSRATAALRLRTINDYHVQTHKAYHDRLYLAQSVAQKNTRTNHELEYDRLLGAPLHGQLGGSAVDRLAALNTYLNK